MFAAQGSAQEIENARAAIVLIAMGIVVFWRIVIRVLLAIIVVAVGAGAFVLMQSVHW